MSTIKLFCFLLVSICIFRCNSLKNIENQNYYSKTDSISDLSINYHLQGDSLLSNGMYAHAKGKFDTASSLFFDQEEWGKYFNAKNKIAECLAEQDSLEKAYYLALHNVNESILYLGKNNAEEGVSYNIIGFYFYATGRLDSALYYFNKYLHIEELNYGRYHRNVSEAYNNIGAVYQSIGDFENCISTYRKALFSLEQSSETDSSLLAQTSNNLAVVYIEHGVYDSAWVYFGESLKIRELTMGAFHPDLAESYENIGLAFQRIGDFDRSLSYVERALNILVHSLGNNHTLVARANNSMGAYHLGMGNYASALNHYFETLRIYMKVFGDTHQEVAACHNNIGATYHCLGQNEIALFYHQQALDINNELNKNDSWEASIAYGNMAAVHDELGMPEKSLFFYNKNLEILIRLFGEANDDIPGVYNNMGLTYGYMNKNEQALNFLEKALSLNTRLWGENHFRTSVIYNNLSHIHHSIGQIDSALNKQTKAIKIQENIEYKNIRMVLRSRINLGWLLFLKGNHNDALEQFQIALSIVESDSDYLKNFYKNPNIDSPNINFTEILELLYSKARALRKRGQQTNNLTDNNAAIETISLAIKLLNNLSQSFLENKDKLKLNEMSQKICEEGINASLFYFNKKDKISKTLFFSENNKSQLLLDQMTETNAIHFSYIPDSLVKKEGRLKKEIAFLEKAKYQGKGNIHITNKLLRTKKERSLLIKYFEKKYPKYFNLIYSNKTISIQNIQDSLLARHQSLLEYFVGDSSIFIFHIQKEKEPQLIEIKKDFPLEEWVEKFRQSLSTTELKDQYIEYGQKLYEKIVAPVAGGLPERVIVVPDGVLGYMPFGALLSGEPEYRPAYSSFPFLVKKHQFSYCYSATLLKEMKEKEHREKPEKAFGIFAPAYDGDTTLLAERYAHDPSMPKGLNPLKGTADEVAKISKYMDNKDIYEGSAARRGQFEEVAKLYRILHLCMHGRADNRSGDYAFLAFSQDKKTKDDGLFFVRELYNLPLNADLVVLSACETGIGKLRRGEGIISLARAFAYAGAKSMVTTLWAVNDQRTSEIMDVFYRELAAGKEKDEALRTAQLEYLKRKGSNLELHPYYWAAFVPVGDMTAIKE